MKKILLALHGPAYYRMYSTDVYCSKQTGSSSTRKPSPIISSFLEVGRRKLSVKIICGGAKMLLKRNPANIRKWIARFYYFRHLYSAGSACVLLTIIVRLLSDMGNSIYTAH